MAFSSSATSLTRLGGCELFMCIVQKPPQREQSFEELRVEDYHKAYVATARPPPPVPDQPDTPKAREALSLPPLFRPIPVELSQSASTSVLPVEKPITSPSDLPTTQIFQITKGDLNDQLQSITAQTTFSSFSFEELRLYAYLSGNIMPPVLPPSEMASLDIAPSRITHSFYVRDTAATAFASASVDPGPPESYMSITASPKFNKHSFEELRIAYLLGGKELTSSQIPASGSLPVPAPPPLLGRPRGETLSIVTPVPSFRF